VNYLEWCVKKPNKLLGRTHEQWLEQYTRWLFGPFPYHRKGEPLFVHGNYNARSGCRKQVNLKDGPDSSVTMFEEDPVIVEVMGANFIIGDVNRSDDAIKNDNDIIRALDFEDRMHSKGKVEFKKISDRLFTSLSSCVDQIRTLPFQFSASRHNPYLAQYH
jgi:hypothetical protein